MIGHACMNEIHLFPNFKIYLKVLGKPNNGRKSMDGNYLW